MNKVISSQPCLNYSEKDFFKLFESQIHVILASSKSCANQYSFCFPHGDHGLEELNQLLGVGLVGEVKVQSLVVRFDADTILQKL